MKGFWLLIGFVLLAVLSKAQDPSGLAAQPGYDWYKYKYLSATEGFYNAQRDTSWKPGTKGVQTVDDKGFINEWDGSKWVKTSGEFQGVNAEWFGVAADGTDQTSKLKAAIDMAALTPSKTLIIQDGTYDVDTLRITTNGLTIRGGRNTIFKKHSGTSGGSGLLQIAANDVTVENIQLEDNGIATTLLSANYSVLGVADFQMQNFHANNIRCIGTNEASAGIFVGWAKNAIVENCYVENLATTIEDTLAQGIAIHSKNGVGYTDGVVISHCTIMGFFRGISSYGTGHRYYVDIHDCTVRGSKDVGVMTYHAPRNRISNVRADSCKNGFFIDNGSEPDLGDLGEGGVVTNIQALYNDSAGVIFEEFQGGSASNITAHHNGTFGLIIGGGCGNSTFNGGSFQFNGVGVKIDRNYNPVNSQIWNISVNGFVCVNNLTHGLQAGAIQGYLAINGGIYAENGTSSADDASSVYAGIWVGKDDNSADSSGSATRIVSIKNAELGNNLPSNVGQSGHQGYGIYLQDSAISSAAYIKGNEFYSNTITDIKTYHNRVSIKDNDFFSSVAPISYDSTKANVIGNSGLLDGVYKNFSDSSFALDRSYNKECLKFSGSEEGLGDIYVWPGNNDRLYLNTVRGTSNTDGHQILDDRYNKDWNVKTAGGSITLDSTYSTVLASANSSDTYITLPSPGGATVWNSPTKQGHVFIIVNSSTTSSHNVYVVTGATFDAISGNDTILIPQYHSVSVQSNNAGSANTWWVIGSQNNKYLSYTNVPTCTVGAGAGTGATCTITTGSNDLNGQVVITTGTSPTANGDIVTITFGTAKSALSFPVISPADGTTLGGNAGISTNSGVTTSFTIKDRATAQPASTTIRFNYYAP